MYLLRKPIMALSTSSAIKSVVSRAGITRAVVDRFVAGESTPDGVRAVAELSRQGLWVTLDRLGENVTDRASAEAAVTGYLDLVSALRAAGRVAGTELSIKLSAIGGGLAESVFPAGGTSDALVNARRIADAAYGAGARVTLDMEDHSTVDTTLEVLAALRGDHPDVGVAVQAMLRRTPRDLRELIGPGSRVRLVKGAYDEPADVAHTDRHEVDLAFVRSMRILMNGKGHPMIASHDRRMVAIAAQLAGEAGRPADRWEYQMLYGIRRDEQVRLATSGHGVRVYVPYGTDWYGYFARRLAERPANLAFFLRALFDRH